MIVYAAFMFLLINHLQYFYTPYHCGVHLEPEEAKDNHFISQRKCQFASVDVWQHIKNETWYLITIIFCIGPLNVFFKIREGKTSLEKIREDYEEERAGNLAGL